jgi:hypothetical protein
MFSQGFCQSTLVVRTLVVRTPIVMTNYLRIYLNKINHFSTDVSFNKGSFYGLSVLHASSIKLNAKKNLKMLHKPHELWLDLNEY